VKAGAYLSLALTIILTLWAVPDYIHNVSAYHSDSEALIRNPSDEAFWNHEIENAEDGERRDGELVIVACFALIGSAVMFSQAKKR